MRVRARFQGESLFVHQLLRALSLIHDDLAEFSGVRVRVRVRVKGKVKGRATLHVDPGAIALHVESVHAIFEPAFGLT